MRGRTIQENRIRLSKEDLKNFFDLLTEKTTLTQLSKKVKLTQPNLTYYKNGKCTMPESFFEYALKNLSEKVKLSDLKSINLEY